MCCASGDKRYSTTLQQAGYKAAHSHICRNPKQQLPIYMRTITNIHYIHGLITVTGLPLRAKQQGAGTCIHAAVAVQQAQQIPSLCRLFTCNLTSASRMNRQYTTHQEFHMSNSRLSSWRHDFACHVAQLHRNDVTAQMQSHTFPQALLSQPRATNATAGAIVPPICANQPKIN